MSKQAGSGFVAEQLGRFAAESQWDALPDAVRHEAKRSLLNFVGGALGVAHTPPIDMAMRVLVPLSGAERVTVLGRAEHLDVLSASFINAISANLLDYDDTHLATVIHPTAPRLHLRNNAGCPGRRCCTRSSWGRKPSAGSATPFHPATMCEGGISRRHAACSAPRWRARNFWAWTRHKRRTPSVSLRANLLA